MSGRVLVPPACILVRHAHAQWPAYQGRDFDRPLTGRGIDDAHATGRALRAEGLAPRLIIASSARRTEQTALILMEHLQLQDDALQLLDSLYNAEASVLEDALSNFMSDGAGLLLVAHNPGISDLARMLSDDELMPAFSPAEWRAFAGIRRAV
jgi:phosphohistidine phosphatase